MKKILSLTAILLCIGIIFCSCSVTDTTGDETSSSEQESTTDGTTVEKAKINIGLLKGPTGMGASQLLAADEAGTAKADYELTLAGAPDVLQAGLINKTLDIAALPTNVAAVLNAKTNGNVQILAVNTLGVMYIMSNSDSVNSMADLSGKTILSAGKGTTTQYVLEYLLEKNNVTDAETEYVSEHAEVITKAAAGGYDVVLLPEPFVTQMKAKDLGFKVSIDLTAEWEKLGNGALTMGCIAVRKDFADENPDAVKAFLEDYKASVESVNKDPEAAGTVIEKFDIAKTAIASKAIPNCNIVAVTGEEMKADVSAYLSVLYSANAQSVGSSLPEDSFYCIVK